MGTDSECQRARRRPPAVPNAEHSHLRHTLEPGAACHLDLGCSLVCVSFDSTARARKSTILTPQRVFVRPYCARGSFTGGLQTMNLTQTPRWALISSRESHSIALLGLLRPIPAGPVSLQTTPPSRPRHIHRPNRILPRLSHNPELSGRLNRYR